MRAVVIASQGLVSSELLGSANPGDVGRNVSFVAFYGPVMGGLTPRAVACT